MCIAYKIHFTNSKKTGTEKLKLGTQCGNQIPGLWINPCLGFTFSSCFDSDGSYTKNFPAIIGKQHHIVVRQLTNSHFEIEIDGEVKFTEKNRKPKDFSNVKAYFGSPWDTAPPEQMVQTESFRWNLLGKFDFRIMINQYSFSKNLFAINLLQKYQFYHTLLQIRRNPQFSVGKL